MMKKKLADIVLRSVLFLLAPLFLAVSHCTPVPGEVVIKMSFVHLACAMRSVRSITTTLSLGVLENAVTFVDQVTRTMA